MCNRDNKIIVHFLGSFQTIFNFGFFLQQIAQKQCNFWAVFKPFFYFRFSKDIARYSSNMQNELKQKHKAINDKKS